MKKTKTLHALLIGINNYPQSPLGGCINDVLAVNQYFQKLCDAQEEEIQWNPKFLLAPLANEKELLKEKGITYQHPTRQNIINTFQHFNQAKEDAGDFCLFYYSGHGSYVSTQKIPLFEAYEPSGELQSLVTLDEDTTSKTLQHLLDKELGYLIAEAVQGKPNMHFLTIMDCCHSGTNTRSNQAEIKARMHSGSGVKIPKQIHGFTEEGNFFYKPLKENKKVQPGGITSARHVNMGASQSSESAYEMPLNRIQEGGDDKKERHGIFTVSLLKTLEQSGTNISYGELMQRIRMDVRSRVEKQIPLLDTMDYKDSDLFFLQNDFAPLRQEYTVSFRQKTNEWILSAGEIMGIIPPNDSPTILQLNDNEQRQVHVKTVRATESVLDHNAFTDADKNNQLLKATIKSMAYPKVKITFGESLPDHMRQQVEEIWKNKTFDFIQLVNPNESYQYEINRIVNKNGLENFILTRPGSSVPLFERHQYAEVLLRDTEKVARYENVVNMNNPKSTIPREDFEVEVNVLEGVPFGADTLNDIPLQQYRSVDPENAKVFFKKVNGNYQQPAIKVRVNCNNHNKVYWIGALYCDAQFGITDEYLQVQQVGKLAKEYVDLEFTMNDAGQIQKWQSIPLYVSKDWHDLGVTEIIDHIIIFISDAQQPFSLKEFNQDKIALDTTRSAGFVSSKKQKKDSWRTIKIPIHISMPKEKVTLQFGQTQDLAAIRLETNSSTPFQIQITNTASAKRKLEGAKSFQNEKALLPPPHLWNNVEGVEDVFSQCPANEPDMQLNILELTPSRGNEISADTTLSISPKDTPSNDEVIVPFSYDQESGLYLPIGQTDKNNTIQIEQLPPLSEILIGADGVELDEAEKSIRGSIKLFFKKIIWSKLSGKHDYHQLSWFYQDGDEIQQIIYNTSKSTMEGKEKIKAKIADAKNVLLLVHGITGDTEGMVDWAFNLTETSKQYDVVLAFDYENLCSGITNIAKALKQILLDCEVHNKQLTILAHSMGGLVTRWMIEKEDGALLVKKLIQVGTPNGGTNLSELRKKMTGWLTLGMNGLTYIQPYMPVVTFLSQRIFNPLFITLNDMHPESKFLNALNDPNNKTDVPYHLIAGKTSHIEAFYQEDDPMYKKLQACILDRGHYFLADFFHDEKENDFVVPVKSMQAVPWGHQEVVVVDCDHFGYFGKEIIEVSLLKT